MTALGRADYLEGALFFFPMLALCAAAGWFAASRRLPGLARVELGLAWFVLTGVAILLAHLAPGILGVLTRATVLAAAALIALAASRTPRAAGPAMAPPPASPAGPAWEWGIAGVGAAAALLGALAYLAKRSTSVIDAIDSLSFHLPAVARWIQNDSIWGLHQFTPDFSNATYPHNGLVMQLAAVLPWEDDFLVRFVNAPFVLALAVAVWAIARELRAPHATALLAAAAATAIPAIAYPALEQAQVDAPSLAWLAIGALFLVRWVRTRDARELLPAALGLGLAFGTKWYHVVFVPVLVAVAFGGAFYATRRWRELVRPLVLTGAGVALAGGFWLIRNWVETGNPVYPATVGPLFDAPYSRLDAYAGFRVWDYLTDWAIWKDWLVPAYEEQFGLLAPVVIAAVAVAAVVAWRRRDRGMLLVAGTAALLAVLYTRLPWTAYGPPGEPYLVGANARYAAPALLAGLVVAAWLAGRAGRLRAVVDVALLVAALDGVRRTYDGIGAGNVALAVAAVTGLALACALVSVIASRARGRARAVVAVGLALLAATAVGEGARRRANADSFARYDPAYAWIEANAPAGKRIGLAGLWSLRGASPVLPAFGPRLGNRVEYVGPFVEGTLREHRDRARFQAALRRGRYDLVIAGLGFARELPPAQVRAARWTQELGYRPVARSRRLLLLAAPGTMAGR